MRIHLVKESLTYLKLTEHFTRYVWEEFTGFLGPYDGRSDRRQTRNAQRSILPSSKTAQHPSCPVQWLGTKFRHLPLT